MPARGPVGDALLAKNYASSFAKLPHRALVASSSIRRRAQMLHSPAGFADCRYSRQRRDCAFANLLDSDMDGLILRRPASNGWDWADISRKSLILPGCCQPSARVPSVWNAARTMREHATFWRKSTNRSRAACVLAERRALARPGRRLPSAHRSQYHGARAESQFARGGVDMRNGQTVHLRRDHRTHERHRTFGPSAAEELLGVWCALDIGGREVDKAVEEFL